MVEMREPPGEKCKLSRRLQENQPVGLQIQGSNHTSGVQFRMKSNARSDTKQQLKLCLHVAYQQALWLQSSLSRLRKKSLDAEWVRGFARHPSDADMVEAFLARLGRMQDGIEYQLLPAYREVIRAASIGESPLLECSDERWDELRQARSACSMDSELAPERLADGIKLLCSSAPALFHVYDELREQIRIAIGPGIELPPAITSQTAVRQKSVEPSLSKRAILTFLSQALLQVVGLFAGLLFTPIIIRGLGAELYGVWTMIQRGTGFLGITNLNATGVLKLQLGLRQHSDDAAEKRRLVGANLLQWVLLTPLLLLVGGAAIFFSPQFMGIEADYLASTRWTMAIMVANLSLTQLFSLPAAILAGQNLRYKATLLNAGMFLLGSVLNVVGVLMGYGIVVLATTTTIGILLNAPLQMWIAKKHVAWAGISRNPLNLSLKDR